MLVEKTGKSWNDTCGCSYFAITVYICVWITGLALAGYNPSVKIFLTLVYFSCTASCQRNTVKISKVQSFFQNSSAVIKSRNHAQFQWLQGTEVHQLCAETIAFLCSEIPLFFFFPAIILPLPYHLPQEIPDFTKAATMTRNIKRLLIHKL